MLPLDDIPPDLLAGFMPNGFSLALFLTGNTLLYVLLGLIILLILASSMVSGSEIAFFSIRPNQLQEHAHSKKAGERRIFSLLQKPRYLLATILIANNLINIAIILTSNFFIDQLIDFSTQPVWYEWVIKIFLVTFLIVFFGEVLPKIYATQRGKALAAFMSKPLSILNVLLLPLSSMLVKSSKVVENRLAKRERETLSADELDMAIDLTVNQENTSEDEMNMLKSIVRFGDIAAKDVMTARPDIFALSQEQSYSDVLDLIRNQGFSRIPVYDQDLDEVKGLLYVKDLLSHFEESPYFKWTSLLRPAYFVPENKKIDNLLEDFQQNKTHMAIVVDEYGSTVGVVTMEDVLEEIIGEIKDEFDDIDQEIFYEKLDEFTYIFEGKASLYDLCKIIDEDFHQFEDVKGEADSLAGLVLELAGRIPRRGEEIKHEGFTFKILDSEKKRINRLKVSLEPK